MSEIIDLSSFVEPTGPKTAHITLAVEGVTCASCMHRIEAGLAGVPGVIAARLNFSQRRLGVDFRPAEIDAPAIIEAIAALGYRAYPFSPGRVEAEEERRAKRLLRCLGVAGFAAMNVMLLSISVWSGNASDMSAETRDLFHWLSALIALPAAAYAGQPFFASAWRALRARSLNVDVPITIGVTLALVLSVGETAVHAPHAYFDSALMLLFFLLCGRYLDQAVRRKTRAFAGNLASFQAEFAQRIEPNGEIIRVPAAELQPGDFIMVQPGQRIAADGTVADGASEIDESPITGETMPRAVSAGATVYAGSTNFDGALMIRVSAAGAGTLMAEVDRLLRRATESKSPSMRLADRASRLYAPLVHATAAMTLIGWLAAGATFHAAIVAAVAVLIITCPCALALAIPAVQVVAAGRLFRCGLIIQNGDLIERLGQIDTIVFDKTGTLTLPHGSVAETANVAPALLEKAARLALSSHHPLAMALAQRAGERRPYPGAVEQAGSGVRALIDGEEARLGSARFCGLNMAPPFTSPDDASFIAFSYRGATALIPVRQAIRPDAVRVVGGLRRSGFNVIVLSGDRPEAVAPIAQQLGLGDWRAGLTPADKIAIVEDLAACGRHVLMVGDGLNDAPALAAADVSLSPVAAAHLAQAHADAVFLGDGLEPVLQAVMIAGKARALMRQNLALAAVYNGVAVPIAIAGWVTPLIAAIAMSLSSLLVTLNALRAGQPPAIDRPLASAERTALTTPIRIPSRHSPDPKMQPRQQSHERPNLEPAA